MKTTFNFDLLTMDEALNCNGGGFAYDVGSVLGFVWRYAQGMTGQAEAYLVWYAQHPQ
jgi:hypothetical protein